MAKPSLLEALIGGFAYFVESGTTVDGATVSATVKPDVDPAANWTANTLGTIMNILYDKEEINDDYMEALASGGFAKKNRRFVTQDFLVLETREQGELVHRLTHGLAAVIAEGTAQTPGAQLDRKIEGWLRLQGRQLGGTDRFIGDWWCECRLETKTEYGAKVSQPKLRFTLIRAVSGTAVAGNSVNFPSA